MSTKNLAAAVERARTEYERASATFASAEARASKARGGYESSSGSDAAADELGRAKIALELATERRDATRVALDAAETALSAAELEVRERAERASQEAERKARLDALRSAASLDTYQAKTDPLVAEALRAHEAMTRAFDGIAEAFDATNTAAKTLREEGEECPDLHELHLLGPVIREMGGIVGDNFGTISSRARFDAARDGFKDVVIGAPGSRGGQFELERDVLAVQLECRALPEMLEARREVELATGACDCDAPAVARYVEDIGGRVGAKCSACHRPLPLKSLESHEDGAHVLAQTNDTLSFRGVSCHPQSGERVHAKFPHSGIERAMSRAKARSARKGSAAAAVEAPAAKRGSLARVAALFENLVGRHFRSARPAREEAIAPSPPAVETAPTDAEDEEALAPVEPLPSLGQDAGSPW
jgi:hypothetical protein